MPIDAVDAAECSYPLIASLAVAVAEQVVYHDFVSACMVVTVQQTGVAADADVEAEAEAEVEVEAEVVAVAELH